MGLIYQGGSWFEAKICGGRSSICCAAVGGISEVFIVSCALRGIDSLIDSDFLSISEYACVGFGQDSWF